MKKNSALHQTGLRCFVISVLASAFFGTFLIGKSSAQIADQAGPPNVLLFLTDDLAFHDLGPYGNQVVRTPNVDRLAEEGMIFEYAFNSAPMCAPTRMSLYSGIHPVRNGGYPNHGRAYDWVRSLPDYLGDLGYRVAQLGKSHEAPWKSFNFEFLGGRHHDHGDGIDLELTKVDQFIEESRGRPWCLVVTSNQSHTPWNRGDVSTYRPEDVWIPPYLVDTPETRLEMIRYYAEIEYMDTQLGHCLKVLDESGETDRTIVIFLSEQGSEFAFGKWTCNEMGLRSAAIFRWPGRVNAGSWNDTIFQYVDVAPTLVAAAGAKPEEVADFDGKNMLPELLGSGIVESLYAYGVQTSVKTPHGAVLGPTDVAKAKTGPYASRSIRDQRYRLIWNIHHEETYFNRTIERGESFKSWVRLAEEGDEFAASRVSAYRNRPEFELYDYSNDPWELINLAGNPEYDEVRQSLFQELQLWMYQQGDKGHQTEVDATKRTPQKGERGGEVRSDLEVDI
ncbi:MAG: sulfatase [Opitutales bacterium]|nr:sulfatase [Opitutales bacterium]